MTKAKAKTLAAELIERGYAPQITERAGDYTIAVSVSAGLPTSAVSQIESLLTITAFNQVVSFN